MRNAQQQRGESSEEQSSQPYIPQVRMREQWRDTGDELQKASGRNFGCNSSKELDYGRGREERGERSGGAG